MLVGALWAWLAPPIHGVVALTHSGERLHDYLGSEADHFFVAAFLMLGLLNVVAAVAAVLAWQWRAHRGPGMVTGLCAGVVIAAGAAVGVGVLLVHLRYGTVDFAAAPVSHDHPVYYFTEAPPVFFGPSWLQMRLHAAATGRDRRAGLRGTGRGNRARRSRRLSGRRRRCIRGLTARRARRRHSGRR